MLIQLVKRKEYAIILVLVGVFTLLPFLLLSIYNHPSYDDYQIALRDEVNGFLQTQADVYLNWSGRYFATAISRINPLLFHSILIYKVYAGALLVLLASAFYLIIRCVYNKYYSTLDVTAICSMMIAVYFVQMPDIAQGVYWFSGYMTYQFANVLTLLLLACLHQLFHVQRKPLRIIYLLLTVLLAVSIIGSNEMSLVGVMMLLMLLACFSWNSNASVKPHLALLLAICIMASFAAVLAPGNYARMHTQAHPSNFILSVLGALGFTAIAFYKWGAVLLTSSFIYALLWGIPLACKEQKDTFFEVNLIISVLVFLASIFLMYFVFTWASGERAGTRVENVIYFFFVLGWYFNFQLLLNKCFNSRVLVGGVLPKLLAPLSLFLFFISITELRSNITTAYLDLFSGSAHKFDEELKRRYSYLKDSPCSSCQVPTVTVLPKSLYIWHMLPKSEVNEMGINNNFATYWGKADVNLLGPVPDSKENLDLLKEIGKDLRQKLIN